MALDWPYSVLVVECICMIVRVSSENCVNVCKSVIILY